MGIAAHSLSPSWQDRWWVKCPPELTPETKMRLSSTQYSLFISAIRSSTYFTFWGRYTTGYSQPALIDLGNTVMALAPTSVRKPGHSDPSWQVLSSRPKPWKAKPSG